MTDRPTNAQLLAQAGRALFGDQWQSDMARTLNVTLRRVQYYAANERQPPASMMQEVAGLLEVRAGECKALSKTIAAHVKAKG